MVKALQTGDEISRFLAQANKMIYRFCLTLKDVCYSGINLGLRVAE